MRILAIESSCDDASVAIVEGESLDKSVRVLAERTASQIDIHNRYGGVFPELAAREHFATLLPTIEETLLAYEPTVDPRETLKSLDAIAVTAGPGLIGSLLVGVTVAQVLAMGLGKHLIPVNHLSGHIYSVWLNDAERMSLVGAKQELRITNQGKDASDTPNSLFFILYSPVPEFPALALTVSGGHTHLVWMEDHGRFEVLGHTRDDAAGEAFDKVSVMLGLGYPGGPAIQSAAADWKSQYRNDKGQTNTKTPIPKFPRPMIDEGLEFSFSGLKTAVRYWLDSVSDASPLSSRGRRGNREIPTGKEQRDFSQAARNDKPRNLNPYLIGAAAYETQEAITDVLVTKLLRAAEERHPRSIILAGGVAANQRLREKLIERLTDWEHPRGELGQLHPWGVRSAPALFISSRSHSTDNGAMIGAAALAILATGYNPIDPAHVEARSNWPLESW